MRDPFPIPPIPALSRAVQPLADKYGLYALPLHVHEVLAAALVYTFIQVVVSPWLSTALFPSYYPRGSRAKKANWDAHVVSLVQAVLINGLALWCILFDRERAAMDWEQRIWGYTGLGGMVQSFAAGYFVWDLVVTLLYIDVFGVGLLFHAVSALAVYTWGFRPFLNHYGSTFILYELSTPFLNLHWFFDKLHMTGSRAQLYNGILLIVTFFSCRLIWGTIMSVLVYRDMWSAVHAGPSLAAVGGPATLSSAAVMTPPAADDVMFFARESEAGPIPVWLAAIYVGSNLILHTLNFTWFYKMIHAVRKRFEPAKEKETETETEKTATKTKVPVAVPAGELRKRRFSDLVPTIEIDDDLTEIQ